MFYNGLIKYPKLLRFILLLYKFTSTETEGLQLSLFKFYQDYLLIVNEWILQLYIYVSVTLYLHFHVVNPTIGYFNWNRGLTATIV